MAASETSRAERQMKRWQLRSRRIATARKLLPASIVVILLAMTAWIVARALLPESLARIPIAEVMPNPRYFGRDDKDRPFQISALKALRNAATDKTVVLTDPSISLGGSRMGAKTAAFHLDNGVLTLQGDVAFDDGSGSKLTADQAIVDTKAGVVRGEKASSGGSGVHVEGPMGDIRADAYEVTDQGKRIVLRGAVHGRVTSRGKR
jgi:lipopolysaccharide export system protein LptC